MAEKAPARAVLILNPTSGSSALASNHVSIDEGAEQILAALRQHAIEPEVLYTTPDDPGLELAQQAVQGGAELVIAAGGDGTLHAVAQGLIGSSSTLGIIPMGTMNNIAHSLEIPEDIEEACKVIAQGETSLIDVGRINDHIFLEVAGIGLEAALFPAAEEIKSKGIVSTLRGVMDGLITLFSFRSTRFAISFDGRRVRRFNAVQLSVCNSPYYGAHLRFAPKAVMNDGFLDVLIYKNFSKLDYMRHAISISRGGRVLQMKVTQRKIKTMRIRTQQPIVIHADGTQIGFTPAMITIQPGVLRVRVSTKVVAGPHILDEEKKQRRLFRRTQQATESIEEKGPLHV